MEYKYQVGETVYIQSRYDGIVERQIVSQVEYDNEPAYELNKLVEWHKDGHKLGSATENTQEEQVMWFEEYDTINIQPCPEKVLMKLCDKIVQTHPFFFGMVSEEILTADKINLKN